MKNKERYYTALIKNNGQLNEMDLGEIMGLDATETREIIVQLLSEHKIKYTPNGLCTYSTMKKKK